jgi:hypothetical protein
MDEEDLHNFSSNLNENGDKSDSEHILKIGKTTRGCPKLCLDGFFYTIERKNPNTNCCFWKCERTGTKNLAVEFQRLIKKSRVKLYFVRLSKK